MGLESDKCLILINKIHSPCCHLQNQYCFICCYNRLVWLQMRSGLQSYFGSGDLTRDFCPQTAIMNRPISVCTGDLSSHTPGGALWERSPKELVIIFTYTQIQICKQHAQIDYFIQCNSQLVLYPFEDLVARVILAKYFVFFYNVKVVSPSSIRTNCSD